MAQQPRLFGRRTILPELEGLDPRAKPGLVGLCKDAEPLPGGRGRPAPSHPAKSRLLESFDAAAAASDEPMFHAGPPPALFHGVKRVSVRGFFEAFDQLVGSDRDFATALARMCMGKGISRHESRSVNSALARLLEVHGLAIESVKLPAYVVAWIAQKVSRTRFYPARYGWFSHRGICTWKRGKNGLSVKVSNAFDGNTYAESPLCMGEGSHVVLEFVIEWTGSAFRLNVIERDANGGSRHSKAALNKVVSGRASRYIVDAQLFLSESDSWLPRTCLMGPMKVPEGGHVDPGRVLEKQWSDGTADHYWDVFGAGGWAYGLVRPDGSVRGVPTDWATGYASHRSSGRGIRVTRS